MKNQLKKQNGMSLVEAMIFLALLVMLLGGIVALGMKLFGQTGTNQEQQNIVDLMFNTKSLKSGGTYGASGTNLVPSLIAIEAIPDSMSVSGGVIYNSEGGTVTVVSSGIGYVMTSSNLSQRSCVMLATKISTSNSIATRINSGTAINGAVSSAQATSGCTGSTNTLSWTVAS